MENALIAALVGLIALVISASLIGPIRAAAIRLNLFDQPGERRVHKHPIPRIAGLAIFAGFLFGLAVSFILPVERFPVETGRILLLVMGATVIVGTMLYDDVIGIRPIPKLLIQFAAALIVVAPRYRGPDFGIVIETFNAPFVGTVTLPVFVAIGVTLVWIVGMMNAMNWADGVDGLAGTITLVASLVLFVHTFFRPREDPQFTISLLAIALAGAVLGFLPFNWHPARIIMGDTGAMFLGFALATISIIGGAKIATALLALGIPLLDMTWVIVFRMINGSSPLVADRGHLHHRLLDAGLSQPQIVGTFAAVTALLGVSALALPTRESKLIVLMLLAGLVLAVMAWLARRQSPTSHVVR